MVEYLIKEKLHDLRDDSTSQTAKLLIISSSSQAVLAHGV